MIFAIYSPNLAKNLWKSRKSYFNGICVVVAWITSSYYRKLETHVNMNDGNHSPSGESPPNSSVASNGSVNNDATQQHSSQVQVQRTSRFTHINYPRLRPGSAVIIPVSYDGVVQFTAGSSANDASSPPASNSNSTSTDNNKNTTTNNNNNNNLNNNNAAEVIYSPSDVNIAAPPLAAAAVVSSPYGSIANVNQQPSSPFTLPTPSRLLNRIGSPSEIQTNLSLVANTLNQITNTLEDEKVIKQCVGYIQFIIGQLLQSRKRSRGVGDNVDTVGQVGDNNDEEELNVINSLQQSVAMIQIALNDSLDNATYIKADNNNLRKELNGVRNHLARTVSTYQNDINDLNNIINELQGVLDSTGRADITVYNGRQMTDYEARGEMIDELERTVRTLTINNTNAEVDNRNKQVRIDGQQNMINNLNREIASLRSSEGNIRQRLELMRISKDQAHTQLNHLRGQVDSLYTERRVESEERIAESTSLIDQKIELQEQLAAVNVALQNETDKVSSLLLTQERDRHLLMSAQTKAVNLEKTLEAESRGDVGSAAERANAEAREKVSSI